MNTTKKTALIIEFTSIPDNIKNIIHDWLGFGNDVILPLRSEFSPSPPETWKSQLTQENLENYHKDQSTTNGFKGDLNKFIQDYGLQVDKFLIDQNLDLENIDEIYINICW